MSIEEIVAKYPSLESVLLPAANAEAVNASDEPAAGGGFWLPRLVQSSVAKVTNIAGAFVGGILACTPEAAKQMLSTCLLWSVNLALDGAGALQSDLGDEAVATSDSRTSVLLGRLIERRSAADEAARRLSEHNGDAEAASRAAFAYYLGFRSRVETAALKQVPGPAGLIYSFYAHLRFFAVVALLHGYDTGDAQTLSAVTFAALGYEPNSQLTAEQQLQQVATDALAARLDPVQQLRAAVVAQLLRAASSRLLASELGRELVPACEVLLLTKEVVGALWPSQHQLDKALALFPPRHSDAANVAAALA